MSNHKRLIERFRIHCETQGVYLLKDDESFLLARLMGFKTQDARLVLKSYLEKWLSAEAEGLKGRFEANSALRKFTE